MQFLILFSHIVLKRIFKPLLNEHYVIEKHNVIEEPVVKRGSGRPRVTQQPRAPKKEEGQELKDHLQFSKREGESQKLERRSHKKQQPQERPKSVSWMYQIY